jgi:hypothetical protein
MSSPVMLGKGGRSELTGSADKRDGRAVAQSVLVKMLHFCSGINVAPVLHVRSATMWYHAVAQAGSFLGILDSL